MSSQANTTSVSTQKNVLGEALEACCESNNTGFMRNGYCEVNTQDRGNHSVCAVVSDEFLQFSLNKGNDLITPRPEWRFPGLKAGDRWCLCAARWQEAFEAGVAPLVVLAATHQACLLVLKLDDLKKKAYQPH
ncbi:MAG: DUF2237 family protein [Cellvibrionaceae bacterium]